MENTDCILHCFPFHKKGNPFLFSFKYCSLLINQAIIIEIIIEKEHALKKIMSKSAEWMSKVLHSRNCSPCRKKISSDLVICLSHICMSAKEWLDQFWKAKYKYKILDKVCKLASAFLLGDVEESFDLF